MVWYKRLGFKGNRYGDMERLPIQNTKLKLSPETKTINYKDAKPNNKTRPNR